MINRNNKKGFTIVELVIVIAVIAILAAVLIPTFSSIIAKANQSADQQAVANMNKILATEDAPNNIDGVIEILTANGYSGDLTTYYKNYSLAWVKEGNAIVLVENDAIVYPEQYVGKTYEIINSMATDAEALVGGLTNGKVVYVGDDVDVTDGLAPSEAGNYEVKLNGNTINASNVVGAWVDDAKITISNGVIDGSTITDDDGRVVVAYASMGGTVELSNVQIVAPENANTIQCYGGTMILNNVTAAQSGHSEIGYYNAAIQVVNGYAGDQAKYDAHLTVNGGVYTGNIAIQVSLPGGTVVINDGIFTGNEAIHMDANGTSYKDRSHSITINGGTFNGTIYAGNGSSIVINGGTFSVDVSTVNNVTIGAGKTVVNNGNGTWTVK